MRDWENSDYQYDMVMYDESEYRAQKPIIRQAILNLFPGALAWHYCLNKAGFSDHFRTKIDQFITADVCNQYRGD
jgi:hypothetical protein